MKVFSLNNLSVNTVKETTIDALIKSGISIPTKLKDKDEVKKWRYDVNTAHAFYSAFQGDYAQLRITEKANPSFVLTGFVADYDAKISDVLLNDSLKNNQSGLYPVAHTSRSYSGGIHVLWEFETPVQLINPLLTKGFIDSFYVKAGLKKLLPGFDKNSLKPHMYYTFSNDWVSYGNKVPTSATEQILFEVGSNFKYFEKENKAVCIPFDIVEGELEKKYPGKWNNKYAAGVRGPRLWDPTAKDQTAAVMHPTGIYFFSEGQGFKAWGDPDLLGPTVVAKYEADRVASAVSNFYYVDKRFYRRHDMLGWFEEQRSDVILMMKKAGLFPFVKKGDFTSEVEEAIHHIVLNKRVDGVMPFIFNKNPIVTYNGQTFLNTSKIQCCQMCDHPVKWGENFPWWRIIIEAHFPDEMIRAYHSSWVHWAYRNAYDGNPQNGQALFLMGPPNTGKSLVHNVGLAGLLGGSEDIGRYMLNKEQFNENMFRVGLATIDDDRANSSHQGQLAFAAMVKQIVANHDHMMRRMFHAPIKVPWPGRLAITLNLDAESNRMVPDLNMSNRDKMHMFAIPEDCQIDFPIDPSTGRGTIAQILRAELPFIARWYYDYQIPKEIQGGPRFGVKSYIDPNIEAAAKFQSLEYGLQEMMEEWAISYFHDNPGDSEFFGSSTMLLQELLEMYGNNKMLEGLNHITLPKRLNTLHEKGVDWIKPCCQGKRRGFKIYNPTIDA